MKKSDEKRKLESYGREELEELLLELTSQNAFNKEWLQVKTGNGIPSKQAIHEYKKRIKKAFNDGDRSNLREARASVLEFKKLTNDPAQITELMLYYVETGEEISNKYGDMYEQFYCSIESIFDEAIKTLNKAQSPEMTTLFLPRLRKIAREGAEGWGHKETLEEIYDELDVNAGKNA